MAALMDLTRVITSLDQVITNHLVYQANQGALFEHNPSTPTSRIFDFMSMSPPTFYDTKVVEDP